MSDWIHTECSQIHTVMLYTLEAVGNVIRCIKKIHSCRFLCVYLISEIAHSILVHNTTYENCIKATKCVCGWCQATASKSKCQIRVLPLCFPNIPYLSSVVYEQASNEADWINIMMKIKWKHFPRYWPFVRGIHRSPVNSPHKGQWRGALMFSFICAWMNDWINTCEAGD